MTPTDIVQIFNLVFAVLLVFVWTTAGLTNKAVGWKAAVPVIIGALATTFYTVVIFTDLNEIYPQTYTLLSAMLRLYEFSTLVVGGLLMIWIHARREKDRKILVALKLIEKETDSE